MLFIFWSLGAGFLLLGPVGSTTLGLVFNFLEVDGFFGGMEGGDLARGFNLLGWGIFGGVLGVFLVQGKFGSFIPTQDNHS